MALLMSLFYDSLMLQEYSAHFHEENFDNRPCNGIWREYFLWLPGNLENMSHITMPSTPKSRVKK